MFQYTKQKKSEKEIEIRQMPLYILVLFFISSTEFVKNSPGLWASLLGHVPHHLTAELLDAFDILRLFRSVHMAHSIVGAFDDQDTILVTVFDHQTTFDRIFKVQRFCRLWELVPIIDVGHCWYSYIDGRRLVKWRKWMKTMERY